MVVVNCFFSSSSINQSWENICGCCTLYNTTILVVSLFESYMRMHGNNGFQVASWFFIGRVGGCMTAWVVSTIEVVLYRRLWLVSETPYQPTCCGHPIDIDRWHLRWMEPSCYNFHFSCESTWWWCLIFKTSISWFTIQFIGTQS